MSLETSEVLRKIDSGTKSFTPVSESDQDRNSFDELVELLLSLENRGLVRDVKLNKDHQTAFEYGVVVVGGLTYEGKQVLNGGDIGGAVDRPHDGESLYDRWKIRLLNNPLIAGAVLLFVIIVGAATLKNASFNLLDSDHKIRVSATTYGIDCEKCASAPKFGELESVGDTFVVHANQFGGWYCQLLSGGSVRAFIHTENGRFESQKGASVTAVEGVNTHYKLECSILED